MLEKVEQEQSRREEEKRKIATGRMAPIEDARKSPPSFYKPETPQKPAAEKSFKYEIKVDGKFMPEQCRVRHARGSGRRWVPTKLDAWTMAEDYRVVG